MAINPAPVWGGDSLTISTSVHAGAPVVGGVAYEPPPEPEPEKPKCIDRKDDGSACLAYASGDDGRCAGHRRRARMIAGVDH